ncbi:Sulfotransferase domain-containing protein [Sulfobacillus thermosulfidooxidans DSM 9293]|uniref:Sulfotransferase domain-containing protein n=1 Tax=Sulfobacillus thermosulfidooxidans (strain DSM 9293 / VKM B-1269 / AT-1) TaxID=929705 RepID=A0A1W1WNN0_SULTA|nr:sulfotransferase [Sulfobacillus thermosulfidooxidans]SMC07938.1 Sulfotransferase domain-containing protein [Sulfobacillus thermosulfidooxidans DSM 9293]
MSETGLAKPNLFIVGAAKSATTSLAYALARHSQIFMKVKEPHYFPTKHRVYPVGGPPGTTKPIFNLECYLKLYSEAQNEKYLLDATVEHLYYNACARDIYEFNNDAKILIILRNPIDRAFSSYKHVLRDGREKLSFEESLALEEERIKANWGTIWRFKDVGLYYESVKTYLDVFDSKAKVILTDEFEHDQKRVLEDIFTWLGLEFEPVESETRYNVSGIPTFRLKLINKMRSTPILNKLLEVVVSETQYEAFERANVKPVVMKPETREYLRSYFRDNLEKLGPLINKDLSSWNSS